MKALTLIFLALLAGAANADIPRPAGSKTDVVTHDNRVIYSQPDNTLYSVQKQRVCTTDSQGKQQCYERAVSTLIPK